MKKVYLLLLLNSLFINSQAQNFNWAKREGLWAYDYGYGITTDNTGNVYAVGKYEEINANFSDTLIPCAGNHDIWIAQYSSTGTLNWIRTAGGTSGDYAWGVACDNTYLYTAGEVEGVNETIFFPGSPITLTCVASNDVFVAKYDLAGNLIWAESAGGYEYEKALGVTYDQLGNVYICGLYQGTITFGGNTSINCTTVGENDIFVAKYDKDGTFLWVKHAGGPGRDEAKSIKCDAAGNIYICGLYSDNCVFGSQTLNTYNNTGFFDSFIAKYSPNGTLIWVKTAGGNYDDVAWSLTLDNAGEIYITGEFNDNVLFDAINLVTTGDANVFVTCYDSMGVVQWAKGGGGSLTDRARGISCDGTNLYITGQFGGTATFGSKTVSAADSSDIFMAKINNVGTFIWAKSVGGVADSTELQGYESGIAICAEASGNVYATGCILDGGVFGTTTYDEYGRTDVFVAKITQGPDVIAPTAISYSPTDNSINVPVSSNLVITFNEAVKKGTGNIVIKESGIVTQTIAVSSTNVTVSGNIVTINSTDFTLGASVNVQIAAGVLKDMANNNYIGISNATGWNFTVESTVISVAEISADKTIKLYPNPGNGIFTLDISQVEDKKIEIIIFNCLGEIIDRRINNNSSTVNIDLSAMQSGIYFITINGEHTEFNQKIIIL